MIPNNSVSDFGGTPFFIDSFSGVLADRLRPQDQHHDGRGIESGMHRDGCPEGSGTFVKKTQDHGKDAQSKE